MRHVGEYMSVGCFHDPVIECSECGAWRRRPVQDSQKVAFEIAQLIVKSRPVLAVPDLKKEEHFMWAKLRSIWWFMMHGLEYADAISARIDQLER